MGIIPQPEFLVIAKIAKPQGRRGEVAAKILTDFPERFGALESVFLEGEGKDAPPRQHTLEKAWFHKGRVILKFQGVDSITEAETLRGFDVLIRREERIPAPDGSFYFYELVGCRVVERKAEIERELGTVEAVESAAGRDLLRVRSGEEEFLIPFAEQICRKINIAERRIEVDLPDDLLEVNRPKQRARAGANFSGKFRKKR